MTQTQDDKVADGRDAQRTYVLIPGAGGAASYWDLVVPLLQEAGHQAIAVDLPGDDPAVGLPEYASLVTRAADGATGIVLVAQSFGGWPSIPIKVVTGADDRFLPASFQQAVARDRLGTEPDLLPGGHLNALSRPAELANYLLTVSSP